MQENPPPFAGATALSDITDSAHLPQSYRFQQNYPNLLNATTAISYSLAETGFVRFKIFDLGGRCVAAPVDEPQQAGGYVTAWNAVDLPSWVYL